MKLSDIIAAHIIKIMDESENNSAEIQRNELASMLGCVPSQINYVISSRFIPEHGYIVDSRRGGGGYIRITRKRMEKDEYLMHFLYAIGSELDERSAVAFLGNLLDEGFLTEREYVLLGSTVSNTALGNLPVMARNSVRADIMRHIILRLMK